nr:DegT/DnrJ/EryC1/StrS family aminotransferase [Alphaproteobacteria bacterium]
LSAIPYICGDELFKFEKDFAKLCGAEHCIGVANGLEAISLTMEAWGINKPHMEVICATNSFVATALGISRAGAKPILVEPDEKTFNISPEAIKKAITPNTKAIALTHLYGQPANMDEINSIAKEYSLKVFEDSAQAHLAEYKGRRCGSLGDAAGFSFYPTKNLGAFGDSGAIVTNNSELANKLRVLRNYGSSEKYVHKLLGTNSRMDELQASFLNIKLKKLTEWTAHKRSLAETYIKELKGLSDIVLPFVSEHANPVWHVFTIRILNNKRSELIEYLEKHNIGFNIHYPVPIHLQECYKYLNYKKGDFPIAEKLATEILSLPIDSYNSIEEIKYVANIIRSAMKDIKDNNSNDFSLIDSESKEIVS